MEQEKHQRITLVATKRRLLLIAPTHNPDLERLLHHAERLQNAEDGLAGLLYTFLDRLVGAYLEHAEQIVRDTEDLARRVLVGPKQHLLREIFRVRRRAYTLRRVLAREMPVFAALSNHRLDFWQDEQIGFFEELHDRISEAFGDVEGSRESLGETVEALASLQSNDINRVMKVLTIVSVLFLPPTLIASIYGMNFKIPEYRWPFGYAYALGLMAMLVGGLLYYARRRDWLG